MNKKQLERLHGQLPGEATLSHRIQFFQAKVKEKLAFIETSKKVYGGDVHDRDLYLEELGRLTALNYSEQFPANEAG